MSRILEFTLRGLFPHKSVFPCGLAHTQLMKEKETVSGKEKSRVHVAFYHDGLDSSLCTVTKYISGSLLC